MDVTQLPFNRLIGLEAVDACSGALVRLKDDPRYTNHLGTVHASALLAVAEAGSGAFLLQQFGEQAGVVPVVRRLDAKFRKPTLGAVAARAVAAPDEVARWSGELATKGRVLAVVAVEVVDAAGVIVMSALVEWLIARSPAGG